MLAVGLLVLSALSVCREVKGQPFSFTYVDNDLTPTTYSNLALGDVDGDGDLDVALSGNRNGGAPYLPGLFVSLAGSESFVEDTWTRTFITSAVGTNLWLGPVKFIDLNRDGNLDLFVAGTSTGNEPFAADAEVYLGDGSGGFSPAGVNIESLFAGGGDWGDFDGDGDEDLILTGSDESGLFRTILYENSGGTLSPATTTLPGLAYGDAQWGDMDNDGDLDLVLVGATNAGDFTADIFVNNGNGQFAAANAGFASPVFSSIDLGDYDGDGDLDVAIGGGYLGILLFDSSIQIYRNDQSSYTLVSELDGAFYGELAWGDHDNDGDLDLLTSGSLGGFGSSVSRIFHNNGDDSFSQQINFPGLAFSSSRFGDYDGDGDLDVLTSGLDREDNAVSILFRNDQILLNLPPEPPSGLSSSVTDGQAILTWQPGSDELTAPAGLSYGLRVGTSPGSGDVTRPLSDLSSGRVLVPKRGNADVGRRVVMNLPSGTYYWSVQSIDNSFIGSTFADEQSFVVVNQAINTGTEEPDQKTTNLYDPYPNPAENSVTIPYAVSSGNLGQISVYSSIGRLVAMMNLGRESGTQEIVWDGLNTNGTPVPSGLYFVRLTTSTATQTKTVLIVR